MSLNNNKNDYSINIEELQKIIREALLKFYGNNPNRLKIYKYSNRLTFSCPYCGDSKYDKKKRGNFYLDTLTYKCYNGGCGVFKTLDEFIKDFQLEYLFTSKELLNIKNISKKFSKNIKTKNTIDYFLFDEYKDVLIRRDILKEKLKLTEIRKTEAEQWLLNRNQFPDEKFLWNSRYKSLFLLNLSFNKEYVLGLQIRQINNKYNKYYTYKLSSIYKNLLKNNDKELLSKIEKIDHFSTIFGISTVDFNSTITIFEGPLDSWLFPNSIALCSINNIFPFDIDNKRWFLDGDKIGKEKMKKLILNNESVFLWKKFLNENYIPEKKKWDLNDIINYLIKENKKIKDINLYFSNSPLDIIYI